MWLDTNSGCIDSSTQNTKHQEMDKLGMEKGEIEGEEGFDYNSHFLLHHYYTV